MPAWQPIQDLRWQDFCNQRLWHVAQIWQEQRARLAQSEALAQFNQQMRRKTSIEAGLIENLYSIDRGTTRLLIEQGIEAALIPYGATDRPASEVVRIVRDHEQAFDHIFDLIGSQRGLSVSFIKQLHQLLTRHQDTTEAVDQFGRHFQAPLRRGEWKTQPNNPTRRNGSLHEYCPPEHVASQMDQLVAWHQKHLQQGVCPEAEAAWFHHRFTQIHPFQDGNGRVARYLASLILIKAGWFPLALVVDRDNPERARSTYIHSLEMADDGNLKPLVDLFAVAQERAFLQALSLAERTMADTTEELLQAAADKLERRHHSQHAAPMQQAMAVQDRLARRAAAEMVAQLGPVEKRMPGILTPAPTEHDDVRLDQPDRFRPVVVQAAQFFGYAPHLDDFSRLLGYAVRLGHSVAQIMLAFHPVGRQHLGVMACIAFAFTPLDDVQVLTDRPFVFSHLDKAPESAFVAWCQQALREGLAYWIDRL